MRILIISNLFPPYVLGGYEILCQQVCERLHGRGHRIEVLTTARESGTPLQSDEHPYPVHRTLKLYCPFSKAARFGRGRRWVVSNANARATRRAITDFQPDLIFIWSQLRLTLGSARAAEDSGRTVAYTFNDEHIAGYVTPRRGLTGLVRRAVDDGLLRIGTAGLRFRNSTCISQSVKDRLLGQGVAIPGSAVIFQGIPIEKFPCKESPGVLSSPARVLYVGQLHDYKGVHTAVQAVARLHDEGIPLELTLCGKGPAAYEERLRTLAAQTKAPVHFRGLVSHDALPRIYRDHHVFVFPSTWAEPFGLTHLEAMASGTPVASTAEGGHGEFLRHDQNALIFPPGDDAALAERLRMLFEDPGQMERLARAARAQVEKEFSLDAYTDRLEGWLTSLS